MPLLDAFERSARVLGARVEQPPECQPLELLAAIVQQSCEGDPKEEQ
jgi:hypothetical protein